MKEAISAIFFLAIEAFTLSSAKILKIFRERGFSFQITPNQSCVNSGIALYSIPCLFCEWKIHLSTLLLGQSMVNSTHSVGFFQKILKFLEFFIIGQVLMFFTKSLQIKFVI